MDGRIKYSVGVISDLKIGSHKMKIIIILFCPVAELSGMRKVLALKLLKTAALFLMEELRSCLETFLGTQVRLNPGSWLLQGRKDV